MLAVSSRGAGDLLYIADVESKTLRRVQLPAGSNPGNARLFSGGNGSARIAVPLRDSASVAIVSVLGTGAPTISRVGNAGTCPTDAFSYGNALWVVDANANCRDDYTVLGDARLIRIPDDGSKRDTFPLPGTRGSSVSAIVQNDVAFLSAGGDADFASFPFSLISSGTISRFDLKNRRLASYRLLPAETYGATTKLGLDGFLYVSLYNNLNDFKNKTIKLRADDLSISGAGNGTPYLSLLASGGEDANCMSAQADALGRVHCIVNGTASVTSLLVFDAAGMEVRRVPAGQGGVDLALR